MKIRPMRSLISFVLFRLLPHYILVFFLLVLSNTFSSRTAFAAEDRYLFLGNKNIAPVIYLEGTTPIGIAVDITHALEEHMSQKIEIHAIDWPTAQTLVATGAADALIQINQTAERLKIYDFSDPLLESHFSIFTNSNRVGLSSIQTLRGLKVGVEAGGLPQRLLGEDPAINLVIIPNFLEGFKSINNGSLDAVVVDYRVGSYVIATNNLRGIKVAGDPISPSYSAYAVKKGNTKLLDEINTALKIIKTEGTYQEIIDKWEPSEVIFETKEQMAERVLSIALYASLAFSLITIIWIIILRRELSRRQAAEKAEQKAKKYADRIISSANAMIVCLDLDGKVTVFNEIAEKISGYKKSEVLGRNWFELVVPKNRFPEVWKAFADFQEKGGSIIGDLQNPILTKNGEEKIIAWRNSDLFDDNKVIGTISFGIDITERQKMEERVARLASFPQLSPVPTIEFSEKMEVSFINPAMNNLFLEWGVENPHSLIPPDWQIKLSESTWKKRETGVAEVELSGHFFEERLILTPEFRALRIYAIDITERKQAEQILRDSEEKFSAAFHAAPYLMAITNLDSGTILEVNEGYTALLGYTYDESVGRTTSELSIWANQSDREKFASNLKKDGQVTDFETVLRRKDGTFVTVLDSAKTIILGDKKCILSIAHDITERKRQEDKLKELDRLKDDFLSVTTHELKTPLVPIKAQAQILLAGDYGDLNEKQKEAIEMISRNGEALNLLSSEVLDIAKIKSSKFNLVLKETSINKIISDTVKDMSHLSFEKHLNISVLPLPDIPLMMLDETRIKQVMANLLDNAIKFTPENGSIDVSAKVTYDTVVISVKDTGIGLSQENLGKIFTPFFQVETHENRKYRGTGLGLAICKGIVEAHEGKIWADSDGLGKGSTFSLSLPLK